MAAPRRSTSGAVCAACLYHAAVIEGATVDATLIGRLPLPVTQVRGAALCAPHAVRAARRAEWLADVALGG